MGFQPSHGQRQGGPGRGPGGGGGQLSLPQSVQEFRRVMGEKASFSDDGVMKLAEQLGKDLAAGFQNKDKKQSGRTQVRKVYGEVRALQEKAKSGFNVIRPELRLIQAHVAYAVGRDTLTPPFKEFADRSVARLLEAGSKEELAGFLKFFEALYAHFYFHTSKVGEREG